MKGKRGRPSIPLSKLSNRKSTGLTASPSSPEGIAPAFARGGATKPRLDKKSRGGKAKWMQDLHIKKGAMTEAAKREGVSNVEYEQEHKDDSGKSGKRARLALAFKHANNKK